MMANKLYVAPETPLVFKDSGGDADITLQNLAAGAGRISVQVDRGAGSHARLYKWRAKMPFETAPVVGEYVFLYIAESDGTDVDGLVGAVDAALTAAQAANLQEIGIVRVQTTDVDTAFTASGYCLISERYFSVGVFNSAADNLQNDANTATVTLTPVPDELQ
jgi:hypothetical protein